MRPRRRPSGSPAPRPRARSSGRARTTFAISSSAPEARSRRCPARCSSSAAMIPATKVPWPVPVDAPLPPTKLLPLDDPALELGVRRVDAGVDDRDLHAGEERRRRPRVERAHVRQVPLARGERVVRREREPALLRRAARRTRRRAAARSAGAPALDRERPRTARARANDAPPAPRRRRRRRRPTRRARWPTAKRAASARGPAPRARRRRPLRARAPSPARRRARARARRRSPGPARSARGRSPARRRARPRSAPRVDRRHAAVAQSRPVEPLDGDRRAGEHRPHRAAQRGRVRPARAGRAARPATRTEAR